LPPERSAAFAREELRRRQLVAMTALVLAGARAQPIVIAFEDLHWADPTSLDLLRGIADRGAQAPLLVLATARPEFRPPWSLRSHHSLISLSPLDRAGVARMVGEISASHALAKEVIEGVSERTGGVPLFVEEVTRLLLERGEQGGVQAIPPTLQQSLAARLDRLGPAREVAQIGAVLGRDFAYGLLRNVGELDEPALGWRRASTRPRRLRTAQRVDDPRGGLEVWPGSRMAARLSANLGSSHLALAVRVGLALEAHRPEKHAGGDGLEGGDGAGDADHAPADISRVARRFGQRDGEK
jgi:hypothetical protein